MSNNVVIQGESKFLPFLLKSKRTGRFIPLTGATFLMHIKRTEADLVPLISKGDSSFVKTYADIGKVQVLLTPSDTHQLAPDTYYGELRVRTSSTPALIYKIKFDLEIETTGLPDGLINKGISLIVADQLTAS